MRGGRILLIIGVILILAAVVVGLLLLRGGLRLGTPRPSGEEIMEGTPVPYVPPEGKDIIVAAQDIPRGTLITPNSGAVVTATWPQESAVVELAVTTIGETYGHLARVDIARGSPILEKMLAEGPDELGAIGSDAALQIPTGKVAYALPVSRYSSVAWALQPGDHVDVILSLLTVDLDEEFQTLLPNQASCVSPSEEEGCQSGVLGRLETLPNGWVVNLRPGEPQRPRLVTQLTVQDAVVLQIGDWVEEEEDEGEEEAAPAPAEGSAETGEEQPTPTPKPEAKPLTVAVTPQDALVLKYSQELGANMTLVLRSIGDANKTVDTESVTLQYLFERFNIEQPPKLPYGITPPVQSLEPGTAGEADEQAEEAAGAESRE